MGNTQVIRTVTDDGRVVVNIAWDLDGQNQHHATTTNNNAAAGDGNDDDDDATGAAAGGAQRQQLQEEHNQHQQQRGGGQRRTVSRHLLYTLFGQLVGNRAERRRQQQQQRAAYAAAVPERQKQQQQQHQQTSKLAADLYMLTVDILKRGIISSGPLQIIFDYADLNVQQSTSKTRLYRGRDSDPYTPYLNLNVHHHPNNTYKMGNVKIMVKSKDQGWSDYRHEHGNRTSNTWVYLGLQSDLTASGNNNNNNEHLIKIVQNIHAGREFETVNKEFNNNNNNNDDDDDDKNNENNENVKRLFNKLNSTAKGGGEAAAAAAAAGAAGGGRRGNQDSLVLVTRSKYPGWNCQVKAASIVVVWKPNIAKIEEDWIKSLQAKKENITR